MRGCYPKQKDATLHPSHDKMSTLLTKLEKQTTLIIFKQRFFKFSMTLMFDTLIKNKYSLTNMCEIEL